MHHCWTLARTTFTCLRCQDLAQLLAVHPGPGGAFGRDLTDQRIEIGAGRGVEAAGILEQCPAHALQGRITLLLGPSREVKRMGGMGNDMELVEGDLGVGGDSSLPL